MAGETKQGQCPLSVVVDLDSFFAPNNIEQDRQPRSPQLNSYGDLVDREANLWLRRWHIQQVKGNKLVTGPNPVVPSSPSLNKYGDLIDRGENLWLRQWHIKTMLPSMLTTERDLRELGNLSKAQEWKQGWPSLLRACTMIVLALPVWFSANAFVPEITAEYRVGNAGASLVTVSVNIGFVIATCLASIFRLSDRAQSCFLVMAGSIACGMFSAIMALTPPWLVLLLMRGLTGAALSLVYPILVKHLSTWFRALRGLAIGCMIGSFTIGVALPSLVKAMLPSASWQTGVLAPSCLTIGAALLTLRMRDGPNATRATAVTATAVLHVCQNSSWFYVTLAYVGHSFELFGGWAWMGTFLKVYFEKQGDAESLAPAVTFSVIASGGFGCVVAGYLADKFSRISILLATNIVSGCAVSALPYLSSSAPQWLFLMVAILWGLSVNADSALYSALITEVIPDAKVVGTALTLSIACGFVMTAVAIYVVPLFVHHLGWNVAFPCLGCGSLVSLASILRFTVKVRQDARRHENERSSKESLVTPQSFA